MADLSRGRGADRELPVVMTAKCSRRLKPGEVRRTLLKGPLVGYAIACPGCGFIETHPDLHGEMGYIERDGALVGAEKPYRCMLCAREVRIADGLIRAGQPSG
jgi:DNA-directed RNA polymerase subunit RPC12/RpoP